MCGARKGLRRCEKTERIVMAGVFKDSLMCPSDVFPEQFMIQGINAHIFAVNLVLFSLKTKLTEDRHYACTTILYCQHWEQGFRKIGSQSILNEGLAWLSLEKCIRLRWFEVKRGSFTSRKNKMSQLVENLKTKETELQ